MLILINGNANVVEEWRDRLPLGYLLNPGGGVGVRGAAASGLPWAVDNGAFGKTDPAKFWATVETIRATPGAAAGLAFVVVPDVVGDARSTLGLFWHHLGQLADPDEARDLPLALVGQDGLEDCDFRTYFGFASCFFIGGSTGWKLGRAARRLVRYAKRRGLWVHMGRVNTPARLAYAKSIGCDSVDGTGLTRFSRALLPGIAHEFYGGPRPEVARPMPLFDVA